MWIVHLMNRKEHGIEFCGEVKDKKEIFDSRIRT
jgi:hypothetical protein